MFETYERVYIGGNAACRAGTDGLAVVHACKSPCHQRAVGYRGSLPHQHPHYLTLIRNEDLFLNLIDPPIPLFQLESFAAFMSFAQQQYDDGASVLIHCNQGDSRAPSLALLFLAKHLQVIPSDSYETAEEAFVALYRDYRPGGGIRSFLKDHWPAL